MADTARRKAEENINRVKIIESMIFDLEEDLEFLSVQINDVFRDHGFLSMAITRMEMALRRLKFECENMSKQLLAIEAVPEEDEPAEADEEEQSTQGTEDSDYTLVDENSEPTDEDVDALVIVDDEED
ncbi:1b3d8b0a-0005-4367-85d9-8a11f30e11c6 [Thermothielavioides terrestris]|uniref:Uncharacterized protein n=2 Tax=Thermothielavioides terrestris TaxID=2587410 RepID=G2QZM0_THETT|nr:uncharacterized protein THITE_2128422 [Thermothielavioides terrestris NRRL 8126]AEO66349.1 hypothetical protein THITE_2128422 [Thermothielavioides terrestris NRRL 8126]SPQ25458.1 1b3d8b0a-0005-4367-85d9-8a11f30e11c6 [Thermothielavioides terrestris]